MSRRTKTLSARHRILPAPQRNPIDLVLVQQNGHSATIRLKVGVRLRCGRHRQRQQPEQPTQCMQWTPGWELLRHADSELDPAITPAPGPATGSAASSMLKTKVQVPVAPAAAAPVPVAVPQVKLTPARRLQLLNPGRQPMRSPLQSQLHEARLQCNWADPRTQQLRRHEGKAPTLHIAKLLRICKKCIRITRGCKTALNPKEF